MDAATVQEKLRTARVARLATVGPEGQPHVVPVCFAYNGRLFYTAIDLKPKRAAPERLARVRNIRSRPAVSLLVDDYGEDWEQLWYILVRGTATVLSFRAGREHAEARELLTAKYEQYRAGLLAEDALIIRIQPDRILSWGQP